MARKFLTPIDLNRLELQNAVVQNLGTDPETAVDGQIYYNSGSDKLRLYSAGVWTDLSTGSTVTINGTTNEVTVTASGSTYTISLPDTINANLNGNAASATYATTAGTANAVAANSVTLGTDTTGNYVAGVSAGTGIGVSGSGSEGATVTISNNGVVSVTGTANEIDVSASVGAVTLSLPSTINADTTGNAATSTKWASPITLSLGSDLSGSASVDGSGNVTLNATIAANSVALGTDTTGDYVASVAAGTGISVSGTGEGAAVTVTNAGVTSLAGTSNQVSVSASTGAVTLSLPQNIHTGANPTFAGVTAGNIQVGITGDNEIDTSSGNLTIDSVGGTVTIDDNLIVTGDLTVSGSVTYINTETLEVADNIVILNSNVTGSPTENAGIEIERGTSTNTSLLWNETSDTWTLTNDGTNYHDIVRRYATNVGNSASTVFTITHNLGSRDVVVQVYDSSTYETVEVDVVRTSTSVVTLTFAVAPSTNAYRVVVTG